jgi:transglutaminase-like putative cysteine protease
MLRCRIVTMTGQGTARQLLASQHGRERKTTVGDQPPAVTADQRIQSSSRRGLRSGDDALAGKPSSEIKLRESGTRLQAAARRAARNSDDRWWTFDPRNNARRKGRVVIGRGRDASDVAMATTFGGPDLEMMSVQAEEVSG